MKSKARMAKTRWRRLFCRKQVLQYTIMYTKICTTGRLFFLSSHAQLMRVRMFEATNNNIIITIECKIRLKLGALSKTYQATAGPDLYL